MLAYSASKAAVIGMTKVQGKEYAQTGVTVNALAPAVIRTDMVAALPEEQVTYMTDKIPMNRCGTLDELAHMAGFIVSPENSFTTGFTFDRSEEHTSELLSRGHLVCRLLLEKKNTINTSMASTTLLKYTIAWNKI